MCAVVDISVVKSVCFMAIKPPKEVTNDCFNVLNNTCSCQSNLVVKGSF